MSHAESTTRLLFAPRAMAIRVGAIGGVIAAAVGWRLLHGAGFGPVPLPHPHAPRLALLAAAPAVIRFHIAAAVTALAVGSALLAGVKGTRLHRALGWMWCAAMMATAVSSLFIRVVNPGHWSFIHFLSGWVIVAVPMGLAAARRRDIALHRRMMTGLFVGGLLIAGAFTFAPGRLMWDVFLG